VLHGVNLSTVLGKCEIINWSLNVLCGLETA
jgi:hypothetical protein